MPLRTRSLVMMLPSVDTVQYPSAARDAVTSSGGENPRGKRGQEYARGEEV